MKLKIPNREVLITDSVAPKKRNKLWWNDESWLHQKADSKLKEEFITARKVFDKAVLNCKRNYWRERQQEIQEASGNTHNFWRMVNSMGVGNERRKEIPMEIVGENGDLVRDKNAVLERWKSDFQKLSNPVNDTPAMINYGTTPNGVDEVAHILNDRITKDSVRNAVMSANKGKATGCDQIPVEVLQNDVVINFLHVLFSRCFNSGFVPHEWGKG